MIQFATILFLVYFPMTSEIYKATFLSVLGRVLSQSKNIDEIVSEEFKERAISIAISYAAQAMIDSKDYV